MCTCSLYCSGGEWQPYKQIQLQIQIRAEKENKEK